MQEDSKNDNLSLSSKKSIQTAFIKRSNARVGNLSLRCRTKSENGILCGDSDCSSVLDSKFTSQLDSQLISIDKEAEQYIQLRNRPPKRHISNAQENSNEVVVTAIYSYSANNEDELELQPGDKVRVLSNDFRDSGTEGWWVGQRDSQIGVFPMNFVKSETNWSVTGEHDQHVPEITPRTPNENFKINLSNENSLKRGKIETSSCKIINNNISNGNGFGIASTAGVRMIPCAEIEKLEVGLSCLIGPTERLFPFACHIVLGEWRFRYCLPWPLAE